ncbi:GRIM-19 protein domain-containing protein [Phthorimaea operculella]|nr:GRIM-19 protein domain-containing protein [Phthorimaea operculella]
MSTSSTCCIKRTQDMPPPGGYKPIPWKRVPAKQFFNGYFLFAAYAVVTTGALYLFYLTEKQIKRHEIELRSNKMAIYPMLLAERDRAFLKQLRKNRDEEERLMADVPGWKVGHYYDEKVYNLIPSSAYVQPNFHEYYAHTDPKEFFRRAYLKLWS